MWDMMMRVTSLPGRTHSELSAENKELPPIRLYLLTQVAACPLLSSENNWSRPKGKKKTRRQTKPTTGEKYTA